MGDPYRIKAARRVTLTGFVVNLLLTAAKLGAGIYGRSSAMLADGVHSLSDFATDIVVLAFLGISGKERDKDHSYGHGKFETFATLLISLSLVAVGFGILINGFQKIIQSVKGELIDQPGMIAFYAAIISIASKEVLFWYTITKLPCLQWK